VVANVFMLSPSGLFSRVLVAPSEALPKQCTRGNPPPVGGESSCLKSLPLSAFFVLVIFGGEDCVTQLTQRFTLGEHLTACPDDLATLASCLK